MTDTGIVILAAGCSSRLGSPKQLLRHQNKTLLQHTVDEALDAKLGPVAVVLGHKAESIAESITNESVQVVINSRWQEGLATSIVTGLSKTVPLNPGMQNVILAVCDQPFLSAAVFQQLHATHVQSGKGIVGSCYASTIGTPVLFHRRYFPHLLQLKGEEGAKKILRLFEDDGTTVLFPGGEIDIDRAEDYKRLTSSQGGKST